MALPALLLSIVQPDEPTQLLASPVRRRLFELVLENPGISMSALADRAQMHWGAVQFHLVRMDAAGLVSTFRVGRRRLVFARQDIDAGAPTAIGLLDEPACRQVAQAVLEHPGRDVVQLAEITALSVRVVYHHAKHLVDAGLVETAAAGHYRGLRATMRLYSLLVER